MLESVKVNASFQHTSTTQIVIKDMPFTHVNAQYAPNAVNTCPARNLIDEIIHSEQREPSSPEEPQVLPPPPRAP
jgi:hypothetical protein